MKANVNRVDASEILKTLPPDQAFLFFEDIGKYTGKLAANLDDFHGIVKTIDMKSLIFHFRRGDYEKWIRESIRDLELARRLKRINKTSSGEELRKKILQPVIRRLDELHKMSHQKPPAHKRARRKSRPKIAPAKSRTRKDC
jgi:hypothetical protein